MRQLKKQALFVVLIPLFFVIHGFKENFGFIGAADAALLMLTYCIAAIALYLVSFIFLRDKIRSALFASFIFSGYLFFGAIYDFLKEYISALGRYAVLLPAFFILIIASFIYLKRSKKNFTTISLYLNVLLLIYVAIDTTAIAIRIMHPPANKFSVYSSIADNNKYKEVYDVQKPDIYFLLFDEYASSLALRQDYGYDNNLDSFLTDRGFNIQQKSYSNYNYTFLSMPSILNMAYLKANGNKKTIVPANDFGYLSKLIANNEIIRFLSVQKYNIVNYSIFDLAGKPTLVNQSFLPLSTRLISDNTLFSRIYKDLGWVAFASRFGIEQSFTTKIASVKHNNNMLFDSVVMQSLKPSAQPSFIYAHFYMPHDPFIFDEHGRERSEKSIRDDGSGDLRDAKSYLGYLKYTNDKIRKLIDIIQRNTKGKAVIILMGDHGFRQDIKQNDHQSFQNMNAVYFPDHDYHLLYDSISGVNQFRVIFNTLFHQSFPLQKDSTIFFQ